MVTLKTQKALMVVFSFTGPEDVERWMNRGGELLGRYCRGEGIETSLVT